MDRQTNEVASNDSTDGTANPPDRQGILTLQMLTLVELEQKQIESIAQSVPGGADNVQDIYPLTPPQEGMLFHHLLNEQSDTYVVSTLLELESRARVEALIGALQMVVDRHDILRTAVLWEQLPRPVQVVYRIVQLPVEELVLAPDRDALEQLEERMTPQRQKWNLRKAPLIRLQVATDVRGTRWYALLQLHHVICDHGSLKLVVAEAMRHLEGRSRSLPKAIAYRTHVAHSLAKSKTQDAEAFFRSKLSLIDEPTAPFGLVDVQGDGTRIGEARRLMDPALAQRVRTQARRLRVTAARVFHAAWAIVVSHTTGRDEVVFGTALLATRQRSALGQSVLGMFVNTLPLRLKLNDVTARELIDQVQHELGELLKYEETSLAVAQRCSGLAGSDPLFTSVLTYRHSIPNPENEWSSAAGIRVITANQFRTNYPVTLTVDNLGEGFELTAQTDGSIDPARVAAYLQTAVRSLVEALEKAPETPALALSILPTSERHQVIDLFNATHAPYPYDKLIHELFQRQVARTPDAIAVVDDVRRLTYAELNEKANQLAHYLREQGVRIGECIPILMGRCLQMLVAQLAVLKAGGVYVPLDPQHPVERQAFLIRDCGARRVLTDQVACAGLEEEPIQWIDFDCANVSGTISDYPKDNLRSHTQSPLAAYVMYTSGSTGAPKGVVIPHHAVNRLVINNGYAKVESTDCIAHCSNPAFDASTFEIWTALLNGASLLIVPQSVVLEGRRFAALLKEQCVTVLWLTVGLFTQYKEALADTFPQLKYLMVGGDVVDPSAVRWVLRNCPPRYLLNGYGPTECTTFSATHLIEAVETDTAFIPIGRPISNTQIYILDRRLQPVPIGVAGEICIGGAGVALGYLNRPEMSAERFIPNPFSTDPLARLYKSGDRGRWRADGTIEFLGRVDEQMKIRGFRIEPGEVAAHLLQHPRVKEAVVLAREDMPGERRLVCYVVGNRNAAHEASSDHAREQLRNVIVGEWETLYQETYGAQNPITGPSFVGWNSSYTGQPIPETQMQEWLANTIGRIKALQPNRVLEIGCGVGLLLQHLAPRCLVYVGTDFSASALAQLRPWIAQREELQHVELQHRSATELQNFEAGSFDTVVLNSVVQYFPDIEYLMMVIQGAVRLLRPGGRIFIGDVRDLGTLPMFHSAVQLSKASATVSTGQLRKRIARAMFQDKELVIDPQFFRVLPGTLSGISAAEVYLKRGNSENELTRHRYDVTLQVGEQVSSRALCAPLDWQTAVGSIAEFEAALQERRWCAVSFSNIPNLRLAKEAAARRLIEGSDERLEVRTLRLQLNERSFEEVDPEKIWKVAEAHCYDVTVSPGEQGGFHVKLLDRDRRDEISRAVPRPEGVKAWSAYANDPLESGFRQYLVPQLLEYLRGRLPEYMVPSVWMVLKQLPLTPNGKVDRRALPVPQDRREDMGEYTAPRTDHERTLAELWAQLLQIDQVGVQDNFFELGGHSLLVVQLIERLRRVGLSVEVRRVFESRTLAELARTLTRTSIVQFEVPPNRIPLGCEAITPQMLPLVELAAEQIQQIVQSVPTGVGNIQDIYPLTPLQEGIWFHHLLNVHGGDTYVLPMLLSMPSRDALERFTEALQHVIDRHDVLRSAVLWEQLPRPLHVVYRRATLPVEEISLDRARDPIEQLKERMRPERQRLELRQAPLLRLQVASDTGGVQWYALLQLHHLVCDHESLEILLAEVVAYLEGRCQGLPEPIPYRNHVAETLAHARSHNGDAFFRSKLGEIDEPTAPFGLLDVRGDGSRIVQAEQRLDPVLAQRIRAQARRLSVSAATLFHAAWGLVVSHTSGRDDVVFGSVLLGRLQGNMGAQRVLGMFINTLPLRLQLRGATAEELVEQTQRELVELLAYEQGSLAEAQRCSGIVGSAPLFSSLLNYRHSAVGTESGFGSAAGVKLLASESVTNYPVTLSVDDLGEGFTLTAQSDRQIDPRRITEYVHTAMQSLIEALERAQQIPVLALPVLPEGERRQVLELFNASQEPYAHDKLIHELFEEQVERTPEAVAVTYERQSLTYAELNCRANQLARYLRDEGVAPDHLVGICVERSLEMVVALLGVLKAGGAYVPLDPNYPTERLAYMLKDAAPGVLLTQESLRAKVPMTAEMIALDQSWKEIEEYSALNLERSTTGLLPHHLAYVIYTSGSTGEPKGVMLEHRGLCNLAAMQARAFGVDTDSRILQFASLSFDACTWEWVMALCAGGRLCLVGRNDLTPGEPLRTTLGTLKITHATLPPVGLNALPSHQPEHLNTLIVAGEACPATLVEQWAQGRKFVNAYGPTEATVCATMHVCGPHAAGNPPIGSPVQNAQVYILNEALQPTPIGVTGEIYIGGAGVARGYLKRPELTAERFPANPFSGDPLARLYKTGDLGQWRADGAIDYLGRNDAQVKIRGFRIELGEVEAQLGRHPQVKEAAVIAREDAPAETRLVAYVIPAESTGVRVAPTAEALRMHLKLVLPEYMVPSAFVLLEHMPLTPNGKLNRQALPAPELGAYVSRQYEAPQGEVEEILTGIWQALLRVERVGRRDNFFELGGHSLLVVQVMERLRRIGLSCEVRRIFESPTLADLASTLTTEPVEQFEVPPNRIPPRCEAITPQMLSLVELKSEHIERIVQSVPGGAVNVQDIYPLAPLQEGILFHHLLNEQGGDAYVALTLLSVTSRERLEELIAALQAVIDRHDILRTAVLWEQLPRPVQVVYRLAILPIEEIALNPDRDSMEQLNERMAPERQRIDLRQAPLMQLQIAADPHSEDWYALLRFHHLICDHESLEILIAEVMTYLGAHAERLPEAVAYRNYVAQALAHAQSHNAEAFFRDKLWDVDDSTAPFGLLDVHGDGTQIEQGREQFEPALAHRVRTQARRLSVSAATLFHAAWGLVVACTSGRNDVVFGSVLLGRLHGSAGAQRILGMFINTLPLRLRLQGMTTRQLVEQTQRELVELLSHEQASLAVVQRCSGIVGSAPLFSALLNYRHSVPNPEADWAGARGIKVLVNQDRTNYPVTLSVDDLGEGFSLTAQTDRSIDPHRITAYLRTAVQSLVDALEQAPQTPVLTLPILPTAERHQILELFNDTQVAYPHERLMHELFEEQVRRTPGAPAMMYAGQCLRYDELNGRANQLARYLRNCGVVPNQPVGICVERGLEMIVGLLGILKAGGAYLPLDPNYPTERLMHMVDDAAPQVVLTHQELISLLPSTRALLIDLHAKLEEVAWNVAENLSVAELGLTAQDLVYVIYTSGSTGRPKATAMPHRSMVNLMDWHRKSLGSAEERRVLQFAALSFDVAFQEIFSTLCTGGTIVVPDEWVRRDPSALVELLSSHAIERLFVPPLMLQSIAEYCTATSAVPGSLRDIITAGEQLRISPEIVALFKRLDDCRLHNHYGPTETHVVTSLTLTGDPQQWPTLPAIGKPISNIQIYILDGQRQPVPIGVTAEIYIGGAGVARGYLGRAELTAERFIHDPFRSESGAHLYRTGDLGRWQADGTLEYLGRNDDQVKIRGYRIELGEIEAQLALHPDVKEAAVVAREDAPGQKHLVAYVANYESELNAETLRAYLKTVLPEHMVPSVFVILERLPLTPSGKLDRRALPAPDLGTYTTLNYQPPEGEVEQALADIWRELLRRDRVGRKDDFFELGGHSLLVLKALTRINQSFGTALKVTDAYRSRTIEALGQRISFGGAPDDPFVDLSREAVLDDALVAKPSRRRTPVKAVMLTGAVGFVGRFVLAQLLRDTDATIYCLVRAPSRTQAMSRLRATLSKWDLWRDEYEHRIVAVPGDLRLPLLGIDAASYQELASNTGSIYHCATSMNHLETYAMAKPANVESTRELLKLATHGTPKLINYISTLGVFSSSARDPIRVVTEDSPIDHEKHRTSGGYVASKWVAEKMFMIANERGIPCNIFRLGLVWADTQQGRFDELQRIYRLIKSGLLSGYGIENYRCEMNPTPVDYVARALVFLGIRHSEGQGIFHISSPTQMAEGVFERCNEIMGTSLELVPFYEWVGEIKRLHQEQQSLPLVPLIEFAFSMDRESFYRHLRSSGIERTHFDCTQTHQELEQAGIVAPVLNAELLRVCLESMLCRDADLGGLIYSKRQFDRIEQHARGEL